MNYLASLKAKYCHSWPATIWHYCAPHWTVSRRIGGQRLFFDLNDNIDDLTRRDLLEREAALPFLTSCFSGLVWDVGANIGQFAVPMSAHDNRVIAFDISPRCCELLERTARYNRLPITVVPRPLGITAFNFTPSSTARPTEHLQSSNTSNSTGLAITVQEAVDTFGLPQLVKMDIEGAEKDFFLSNAWKKWLCTNAIHWVVELHPERLDMSVVWNDLPMLQLDQHHFLFHTDIERINYLREHWRALTKCK